MHFALNLPNPIIVITNQQENIDKSIILIAGIFFKSFSAAGGYQSSSPI